MVELTFVQPQYLWLLFIIPALILTHFYGLKSGRKKAIMFANFEAMARVTGGSKLSMNLPLLFLRFFTLFFLILALAAPILWYQGQGGNFNFLLAIDVSGSMLADDFAPNRLGAAKEAAFQFLERAPSDSNVALMGFSGNQFIKQTLTDDRELLRTTLNDMRIEFSSGTAIGDAIITGTNVLLEEDKSRVIILLTDGQSNVGTFIQKAINYANEHYVTVHTIGMATEEGGQFQGIDALSKLDADALTLIAKNTGGGFYKAADKTEVEQAYADIASTSTKKLPIKFAAWLIALTFLTLAVEWIFVNTKFKSIP